MNLKVCGMRDQTNIDDLTSLKPDFMGFIFYDKSARNISNPIIDFIDHRIKRVGVFVNEKMEAILKKHGDYKLDYVQLHGSEDELFCMDLKNKGIDVIKAFPIDKATNFDDFYKYEPYCTYFLFDAKGKMVGGNGIKFDWDILSNYKGKTEYLLSGGIDIDDAFQLKQMSLKDNRMIGIDINSRFEISPAFKDIDKIRKFQNSI